MLLNSTLFFYYDVRSTGVHQCWDTFGQPAYNRQETIAYNFLMLQLIIRRRLVDYPGKWWVDQFWERFGSKTMFEILLQWQIVNTSHTAFNIY